MSDDLQSTQHLLEVRRDFGESFNSVSLFANEASEGPIDVSDLVDHAIIEDHDDYFVVKFIVYKG